MGRTGFSTDPLGLCGSGYDGKLVRKFDEAVTFDHFVNQLYLLAINRYTWYGLPKTVSPRALEQAMIFNGAVCFFKDNILGYLCLPCAKAGRFNIYNIPTTRYINTASGYRHKATEKDSALIYNDQTFRPFMPEIYYFAKKLTMIEKAKDVNTRLQMKPKGFFVDKDNVNSAKIAINEAEDGKPFILVDKNDGFSADTKGVLDFSVPCILEQLEKEKNCIWSEYLTRLGYNNLNIYKKERLIESEAESNEEHILALRDGGLFMRRQGIEKIKQLFPELSDISVEFNPNCNRLSLGVQEIAGIDSTTAQSIGTATTEETVEE